MSRDCRAHCENEQLMVSDATVQEEGCMAGFCSTGWGMEEYIIGRCNFDSHSYEAEACGILRSALLAELRAHACGIGHWNADFAVASLAVPMACTIEARAIQTGEYYRPIVSVS